MDDVDDEIVARLRRAGCVFAEDEARVLSEHAAEIGAALNELVARRCAGEPVEYLLGWALFRGRRIAVAPGVFVPRRRTEYLAELAIVFARQASPPPTVLDLCCGAGAIAATVAASVPGARVHAADVDPVAAACARRNLGRHAAVYVGDLFAPLPDALRGQVDVLVANAPYVPTGEIAFMPPEAREHERRAALDGGADGLDVARRVFAGAPEWLAPGGTVLVELGAAQALELAGTVAAAGLAVDVHHHDDYGETVLAATVPRTGAPSADGRRG